MVVIDYSQNLPCRAVKRVDIAGNPDKLFGKLRTLVDGGYTVVFSAPNYRARQDMKLAFVDHGLPIQERLDLGFDDAEGTLGGSPKRSVAQTVLSSRGGATGASGSCGTRFVSASENPVHTEEHPGIAKRQLRRGAVNVVDVEIPLGMIFPDAKLALVSIADTQGAQQAARVRRRVDITEVTFPYKPGDYVVHAAHGVAFFKELTRREIDGTGRDYLLLEYAEGDKLFVPVEQLDRVTRYVGPKEQARV